MPKTDSDLGEGVKIYLQGETGLAFFGSCVGTPPTTADEFETGAIFVDIQNKIAYLNTGSSASPSWNSMHEIATADLADGSVTPAKTAQTEAVTATADGLTTGLISATARHVTITSDSAAKVVVLPPAVVGKVITGYVGANGCELQTLASSNVKINDVDCDGANEAAIPATTLFKATCVSSTEWILEAVDELGAVITAIVPDADA